MYSNLLQRLADSGCTVISTPYSVTFSHQDCAEKIYETFNDTLGTMRSSSRTAWAVPMNCPISGVGHSNGALVLALIGCFGYSTYDSNVLISFNNLQVKEAVPVPLTPLQSAASTTRSVIGQSLAEATDSILQAAVDLARSTLVTNSKSVQTKLRDQYIGMNDSTLNELRSTISQLGSVLDGLADGQTDFEPVPDVNRALFRERYSVPRTLLIRFSDDSIDETDVLSEALLTRKEFGIKYEVMDIEGNHLTPVSPRFPVLRDVRDFGPSDALAQGLLSLSQQSSSNLAKRIMSWM